MAEYDIPDNPRQLFANGERGYRIEDRDQAGDNIFALQLFLECVGVPVDMVETDEGTRVTLFDGIRRIAIDSGGLGDFHLHGYDVTVLADKAEKVRWDELVIRRNVTEEDLQQHGFALEEEWPDGSCFTLHANRLAMLKGQAVAAFALRKDFGEPVDPSDPPEIVALEVLPEYRRHGIATAIVSIVAGDRGIRVLEPNEAMAAVLARMEPLYGVRDPEGCTEAAEARMRARTRV